MSDDSVDERWAHLSREQAGSRPGETGEKLGSGREMFGKCSGAPTVPCPICYRMTVDRRTGVCGACGVDMGGVNMELVRAARKHMRNEMRASDEDIKERGDGPVTFEMYTSERKLRAAQSRLDAVWLVIRELSEWEEFREEFSEGYSEEFSTLEWLQKLVAAVSR